MKSISIITLLIFGTMSLNAQNYKEALRQSAVSIENLKKPSLAIYEKLKDFNLIMMGEMHGTMEPAQFVEGLVKVFTRNGKKVALGLEMPEAEMKTFIKNPNEENLRSAKFFQKPNEYGMNGMNWLELIQGVFQDPSVELFYFDNNTVENRDSSMYLDIKQQYNKFPDHIFITLSGNIHNRMGGFRDMKTMALYLKEDPEIFPVEKIASINHQYGGGTMMNNVGNGLELRTFEWQESLYNSIVDFKMYFSEQVITSKEAYNFFLYTDMVSHASPIK